jgi:hypothetical protein
MKKQIEVAIEKGLILFILCIDAKKMDKLKINPEKHERGGRCLWKKYKGQPQKDCPLIINLR